MRDFSSSRSHSKTALFRKRGQATTEYLVIAVGVGLALTLLSVPVGHQCDDFDSGTVGPCESVMDAMRGAFHQMVTDVTILLNLPH